MLSSTCRSSLSCAAAAGGDGPEAAAVPIPEGMGVIERMSGGDLLSHEVPLAVPSAQLGLASGFGMEPGVSPSL